MCNYSKRFCLHTLPWGCLKHATQNYRVNRYVFIIKSLFIYWFGYLSVNHIESSVLKKQRPFFLTDTMEKITWILQSVTIILHVKTIYLGMSNLVTLLTLMQPFVHNAYLWHDWFENLPNFFYYKLNEFHTGLFKLCNFRFYHLLKGFVRGKQSNPNT